jgi:DNA-binding transcriptional regulator YiaG
MAIISKTIDEIRAHRPDPAMVARLRGRRGEDVAHDADAVTGEPVFRIREAVRRRILGGAYQDGDIAAFRNAFRGVSQSRFAEALGISVDTLQNWEQGRRQPDGPAKALLRLLARHPRLLAHDLMPAPVAG